MRLRKSATLAAGLAFAVWSSLAQAASEQMQELTEALRIGDMVEILRQEGFTHSQQLAADLIPGRANASWSKQITTIYDTGWMEKVVSQTFAEEMRDAALAPLIAFFTSDTGREVVELELKAREALLDEKKEQLAGQLYRRAKRNNSWIYEQITELIEDSDLVEFNVAGSLNSNMMFYRGMADGGAFTLSEEEMLADVWSQEEQIRADSEDWLGPYLMLAYQKLDREELSAYAGLYRTEPGQKFNTAIFTAYNTLYDQISYALGRAIARQLKSEEL
ncbi:MAG: DUF2059 domain-containing protein [Pseudomonadota bacterium]